MTRQLLGRAAALAVTALAALASICTVAPLGAQNPATHLLGPLNPPLADTPGTGNPNPATDTPIGLSRNANTVTITSPWTCNPSSIKNQIVLSDPDTHGRFLRASRFSENLGKTQRTTIVGFDSQGEPTQFLFEELTGSAVTRSGVGTLVSSQNNGVYDSMNIQATLGGSILTTISLEYFNSGSGGGPAMPDYVSFPWGQVSLLGGKSACNGSNPQVFLPVASNGHIIFALNNNGTPDPDLYPSPLIAPATVVVVPALAPAGMAVLAAVLLVAAVRLLRRESRGPDLSGA